MSAAEKSSGLSAVKTDDDVIEEMRAEYGERVVAAKTPSGLIVCRPPTEPEHQRFQDKLGDARKSNTNAYKEMVLACRVHPERNEFRDICKKHPALYRTVADKLDDAAGADIEIVAGK